MDELNKIIDRYTEGNYLIGKTAKEEMAKDILALFSVSNRFSDPKFINNVCLSYRHDFGLLSEDEQNKVRLECKEWMRAIKNNEPKKSI